MLLYNKPPLHRLRLVKSNQLGAAYFQESVYYREDGVDKERWEKIPVVFEEDLVNEKPKILSGYTVED